MGWKNKSIDWVSKLREVGTSGHPSLIRVCWIKIDLIFGYGNYTTKIIRIWETFQHENVFGNTLFKCHFFISVFYIILTFEVEYTLKNKLKT